MKNIVLGLIKGYTTFVSPLLHQLLGVKTACRNSVTCSAYAHKVITEYGIIKGLALSVRRLVNCQPYFTL